MQPERGQVLVLVAIVLIGLVLSLALAIDGGMLFWHRRLMQNAADAASLAGARVLYFEQQDGGVNQSAVLAEVHRLAEENGVLDPSENLEAYYVDCDGVRLSPNQIGTASQELAASACGVEAIVRIEFSTFFLVVVRMDTLAARAGAAAVYTTGGGLWGYAVFADSHDCYSTIDWPGSTTLVGGSVHSNNDIRVGGSDNEVTGTATYVTECDISGSNNDIDCVQSSPKDIGIGTDDAPWNIEDWRPSGDVAGRLAGKTCRGHPAYSSFEGYWEWDGSEEQDKCGVIYVDGYAKISGSDLTGDITVVAEDYIDISGSTQDFRPYYYDEAFRKKYGGLFLFSNKQYGKADDACNVATIKMAGSTHRWAGVVYAPYSMIDMSGSTNTTYYGALIGHRVRLTGSDLEIVYEEDYLPEQLKRIVLIR